MQSVKILIVEDSLLIAENIKSKLSEKGYRITGIVQRGEDVSQAMSEEMPDLIIMDIGLGGKMDGIKATEGLKKVYDIPVIFLTDADDPKTIRRAGKTRPAAYLLKPFAEKQLDVSIQTALFNSSENRAAQIEGDQHEQGQTTYLVNQAVFIKDDYSYKKIEISDILFIEADRAYAHIYMKSKKRITLAKNMSAVLDKISDSSLLQVHRSYAVNVEKIMEIKGNMLLIAGKEIPIGEIYRDDVMKRFRLVR